MIQGITYEQAPTRIIEAVEGFLAYDPLDTNSLDSILGGIRSGQIGVFDVEGSLYFTELYKDNLHVIGMFGGLAEESEQAEALTHLAHMLNANSITIKGRPGWLKVAAKYGYEHLYTIMRKKL